MTATRTAQLVDTILDKGGDDAARSLIILVNAVAEESDALVRESIALTVAQRAFASTTTFDDLLRGFLAGGTHSAQQET